MAKNQKSKIRNQKSGMRNQEFEIPRGAQGTSIQYANASIAKTKVNTITVILTSALNDLRIGHVEPILSQADSRLASCSVSRLM